jgi:hypothetical protein
MLSEPETQQNVTAPTSSQPTTEEVKGLIDEMRRGSFAKKRMQMALLEQLIEAKRHGGASRLTRKMVMGYYEAAVKCRHHEEHPDAFEAGRQAGRRRVKNPPLPEGMDNAAFRAGVKIGKAELVKGDWDFHPVKSLIGALAENLEKYFSENQQSTFIIRLEGIDPKFETRSGPITSWDASQSSDAGAGTGAESASPIQEMSPGAAGERCRTQPDEGHMRQQPLIYIAGRPCPTLKVLDDAFDLATDPWTTKECLANALDLATDPWTRNEFLVVLISSLLDDPIFPSFVDAALVDSLTKIAVSRISTSCAWSLRENALKLLAIIFEKRSELCYGPPIIRHVVVSSVMCPTRVCRGTRWSQDKVFGGWPARIVRAVTEASGSFGIAAHSTVGLILRLRPELTDMKGVILSIMLTAAFHDPDVAEVARKTLGMIVRKRPQDFEGCPDSTLSLKTATLLGQFDIDNKISGEAEMFRVIIENLPEPAPGRNSALNVADQFDKTITAKRPQSPGEAQIAGDAESAFADVIEQTKGRFKWAFVKPELANKNLALLTEHLRRRRAAEHTYASP